MIEIPTPGPERDRLVAGAMGHEVGDYRWEKETFDIILPAGYRVPNYSTDDATFVKECLPWLRSKDIAFEVRMCGNATTFIALYLTDGKRGSMRASVSDGLSLAEAGTTFILKAKVAGLLG